MAQLDHLRDDIEEIDGKLVELIAKRLALALQVGEEKIQKGMPMRDWTVEKQVIARAERMADSFNLPTDLVRKIMQLLIQESCAFQEGLRDLRFNGDLGRILIVGGKGRMGKWFAHFFHTQGHFVSIHDVKGSLPHFPSFQSLPEGVGDASLILLATPLDETPRIYEKLIRLEPSGVICDIASLKSGLLASIRGARDAGLNVASIHPLFGPETRLLSDKVICLCDCGDDKSFKMVKGLFQETSARLVELPVERHDLLASYVLGLSHIINILFARTLSRSGHPYEAFSEVSSTTFTRQMATTISVITENPFLYYEIQKTNVFTPELYRQLSVALDDITGPILSGDREGFVKIMETSRQYLEEQDAMRQITKRETVKE
jgi:chorismate mutase/prephenate dehydrogenase